MRNFPNRIICLTEESVETLYLLGKESCIVGVSEYVRRPTEAMSLPVVTQFIRSDIEAIVALKPDLVLGFSDLQKNIASELIGRGINVFVTNQRSLDEILNYILLLGRIVGEEGKAISLISEFKLKLEKIKKQALNFKYRPKVYFEEWDHPRISAIEWVSELIEVCGGNNIFSNKSKSLAKDRIVFDEEIISLDPEVIFACWCGKPFNASKLLERPGFEKIQAIKNKRVFELQPEIFLQPGPALFIDGVDILFELFQEFQAS